MCKSLLAGELPSFIPLITQIPVEAPDTCWTPWALMEPGAGQSARLCECAPVAQLTSTAKGACGPRRRGTGESHGLREGRAAGWAGLGGR